MGEKTAPIQEKTTYLTFPRNWEFNYLNFIQYFDHK